VFIEAPGKGSVGSLVEPKVPLAKQCRVVTQILKVLTHKGVGQRHAKGHV
jgi:hypothetical protein